MVATVIYNFIDEKCWERVFKVHFTDIYVSTFSLLDRIMFLQFLTISVPMSWWMVARLT